MVVMSRLTLPFADPAALRARTVALTAATAAVTIVVALVIARLSARGPGDAADLVALAREVAAGGEDAFGVALHPEPVFVGSAW